VFTGVEDVVESLEDEDVAVAQSTQPKGAKVLEDSATGNDVKYHAGGPRSKGKTSSKEEVARECSQSKGGQEAEACETRK
jgi:hypothetical protein